jgi:hypothetical protein
MALRFLAIWVDCTAWGMAGEGSFSERVYHHSIMSHYTIHNCEGTNLLDVNHDSMSLALYTSILFSDTAAMQ